jgi:diamine N-acetyltransferase
MGIRELGPEDLSAWLAMRKQLWPDETETALVADTADIHSGRLGVFAWEEDGEPVGFAEVSMRSVVDGARSTPVGYLEGWWVDEDHRRQGIGEALVAAGERWARRRGATEMGSDSVYGNEVGEAAHRALGFEAQGVVTQWIRPIGLPESVAVGGAVALRPITAENVRVVAELTVAPHQRGFVAPNAVSIAQASVADHAWLRAIYADETPVGLVLLNQDMEKPMYYLWRFMIDGRYQGLGLGARAMELVIDQVRSLPEATHLYLSYVPLPGGPGEFYRRIGFVDTGKVEHGEVEAVLALGPGREPRM